MQVLPVATFLAALASLCSAQTGPVFDTQYPYPPGNDRTDVGKGSAAIPASVSSDFFFAVPAVANISVGLLPLRSYSRGFPAVACSNPYQIWNVSFAQLHTPDGTRDYAVHLSRRLPYPNNITGSSHDTSQRIFSLDDNIWLNLRTGTVAALNQTESNPEVFTFDPTLNGRAAALLQGNASQPGIARRVRYISQDEFYGAANNSNAPHRLSHSLYPYPAAVSISSTGTRSSALAWFQAMDSLLFYTGFAALQASREEPCTGAPEGFFELVPLLDYLTLALQDTIARTGVNQTVHEPLAFGDLNSTYVQTSPNVSSNSTYATFTRRAGGASLDVDQVVGTAYLGLTESECIVAAKNYTLTVANVKGSPPANVWNFCAIGVCTFYYADGRFITLQTFGSNNTESVCQLGYSVAVDNNEWVEPAIAQTAGVGNAGRFNPVRPYILPGPNGIVQTSNSTFVGHSIGPGPN